LLFLPCRILSPTFELAAEVGISVSTILAVAYAYGLALLGFPGNTMAWLFDKFPPTQNS
jgi:hypothetical protein